MNDKDFFIKLHQDYPLAMEYMAKNFKCLYTIDTDDTEDERSYLPALGWYFKQITIKHPLKRDLYDFFDGEGIFIEISLDSDGVLYGVCSEDINEYGYKSTRSDAETCAFEKAFEILELRLTKE